MSSSRGRILVLAALLFGAGAASAITALTIYFARYSRFDGLFGEIDSALYAQLTQMAPVEKSALVLGAVLVLGALLLAAVGLLRRPATRS